MARKIIGITGTMGSGKTTVCRVLGAMGIPIYNCDRRGKEIMATDPVVRAEIIGILGNEAYAEGGELNREYIAQRIFSDKAMRARVEGVVHAAVGRDITAWVGECSSEVPYVVVESAVLIGSPIESMVSAVVAVCTDPTTAMERVQKRDALSPQQIQERINAQTPQTLIIERAKYALWTTNSTLLVPKVVELHKFLLSLPPK